MQVVEGPGKPARACKVAYCRELVQVSCESTDSSMNELHNESSIEVSNESTNHYFHAICVFTKGVTFLNSSFLCDPTLL